ncbi:hypothetical protein, partial [Sinorhizobium meliloti]|uniref:hypothetical protein n=1 Tax=Rhizobium meliloti TaxID=382 RepID=UPI0012FE0D92
QTCEVFHFPDMTCFDSFIQVDTSSVLLYSMEELLQQNMTITQLSCPLESYTELTEHFQPDTRTFVINASGCGASTVFGCQPSMPIRGDLMVLKVPLNLIPADLQHIDQYSYWAGSHYVFIRHELYRP